MPEQKKNFTRLLVRIFAGVACAIFLISLLFFMYTLIREERETHRLLIAAFGGVTSGEPTDSSEPSPPDTSHIPAGATDDGDRTDGSVPIVSVDLALTRPGVNNTTSYGVDEEALADRPLIFSPAGKGPLVLILHCDPTECYTPVGVNSVPSSFDYTSADRNETVFAVGEALAEVLRTAGIGVIHADEPAGDAAAIVKKYRQVYPSLTFVLDLHRDGIATTDGRIVRSDGQLADTPAAQLMLAVGTGLSGGGRSGWQSDLAAAHQLANLLAEKESGLMRSTMLCPELLGQGGAPCQLNLYVGTTGNTLPEAVASARLFAKYYAIFVLKHTAV